MKGRRRKRREEEERKGGEGMKGRRRNERNARIPPQIHVLLRGAEWLHQTSPGTLYRAVYLSENVIPAHRTQRMWF
jgi:hypothetical protein